MWRLKELTRTKKGFLLLEVLVSVAVITVGLIYIVRSFSISTRAIVTSRDYLKAVSYMEEKMWGLEESGQVQSGEDSGYLDDAHKFKWELTSKIQEDLPLNETQLKIYWKDKKRRQSLSVATYLWNKED